MMRAQVPLKFQSDDSGDNDDDYEKEPEEDLEDKSDRDKSQEKCVIHEGQRQQIASSECLNFCL